MFRSLERALKNRTQAVLRVEEHEQHLKQVIQEFLSLKYGEQVKYFNPGITYNHKQESVCLETGNKIYAAELNAHLQEMLFYMKKEGISVKSLLIR